MYIWNSHVYRYLPKIQAISKTYNCKTAKFDALIEMETHLPFPFLKREWELMKHPKKAKKPRKYFLSLGNIDIGIYLFLIFTYIVIYIYSSVKAI